MNRISEVYEELETSLRAREKSQSVSKPGIDRTFLAKVESQNNIIIELERERDQLKAKLVEFEERASNFTHEKEELEARLR